MTLSPRMEVLITIAETGVLPLFYSDDSDRASRITGALREGGARAIEFTDRGPAAWSVFSTLTASAARHDPGALLGAGSIRDPYAADRFIAAGARFIVGPSFNADVARLCNTRRIPYLPGCARARLPAAKRHRHRPATPAVHRSAGRQHTSWCATRPPARIAACDGVVS